MSNTQDFENYDYSTLQFVLQPDGLTHLKKPTGETVMVIAWLEVPGDNHDKASIDQLVGLFRAGSGRGANKAICSKCHDEGRYVVWDPKPASLKALHALHQTAASNSVPETKWWFMR
ncbi:hypothetical protein RSAG8_11638, partial [Rhizoctonia solani AG-8 WAC10335]